MRVCDVKKATAQHYKRGTRRPPPPAKRLWELHVQGRILGPDWKGYRVHRNELVDPDGLVYTAGEIATIPFLHAQMAELRKQLDKARYADTLGELGFFDLTEALSALLKDGAKLLKAVEKIPRRTSFQSRPRQDGRLNELPGDPSIHTGVVSDHA